MPTSYLISIIIPTYNYGNRILKALQSIQDQNDSNIEILVIDDGSVDQTKEIVHTFHMSDLHYYYKNNKGVSHSRNLGITLARGEYLLFLDADDYLLPNALLSFREAVAKYPDAGMIAAGCKTFEEKNKTITAQPFTKKLSKSRELNFKNYLRKKISFNQGSCLYKREVFNQIRYPELIKNGEDVSVFFQCLATQDCISIPDPVVMINKHNDSLRHQFDFHKNSGMDIVNYIFDEKVLDKKFFKYRKEFSSSRYLSLTRMAYKNKKFHSVIKYFENAIHLFPRHIVKLMYLKKYIVARVKNWGQNLPFVGIFKSKD